VSYQGVNQTNMVDVISTHTNFPGVASVTTTPAAPNGAIVSAHGAETSATGWTPGNGQTERVDAAMPNSSRSITVTELFSATAGIAIQMTSTPPDFSMPTGSLAVSLKPF
jgi:hypothetical protein